MKQERATLGTIEADRLYTAGEVSRLMRSSPGTVRRWIKAGKLAAVTVPSGRARVKGAELVKSLGDGVK